MQIDDLAKEIRSYSFLGQSFFIEARNELKELNG